MSYRLEKGEPSVSSLFVSDTLRVPIINLNTVPSPQVKPKGSIAFDIASNQTVFSDGNSWKTFTSLVGDSFAGYSLVNQNTLTIPASTPVTIQPLVTDGYETALYMSGWNLTTGIYTCSTTRQTLSIRVKVTWTADISNIGERYLRIIHYSALNDSSSTVCESVIQPSPNVAVPNQQTISTTLRLLMGDRVWVSVQQNSPVSVTIEDGLSTIIEGTRILS